MLSTEGVEKTRQAAEKGDAHSQYQLGRMYEYGLGFKADPVEALKWYNSAARLGMRHAQYKLGRMYQEGVGVEQDHAQAAKWYRYSVKFGHGATPKGTAF